jgi:hypothetical protein
MTYTEYKSHMKVCEFLGKPPLGKFKELHIFTMELWDDMCFTVSENISQPGTLIIIAHKNSIVHILNKPSDGWVACDKRVIMNNLLSIMDTELIIPVQDMMEFIIREHLSTTVINVFTSTRYDIYTEGFPDNCLPGIPDIYTHEISTTIGGIRPEGGT